MATGNNSRDVKMTLSVQTLGSEDIKKLQTDVARLAKEGGDAAPEFQRLADEIARLGEQAAALQSFQALSDQTAELAARQTQAALSTAELRAKLDILQAASAQTVTSQKATSAALNEAQIAARGTRDALAVLSNETDRAGKTEAAYIAKKKELGAAAITQRAEVERLASALTQANASVTQAAVAESKLTTAYERSAKASSAANAALTANAQQVERASQVALELGVVTDNVASAQAELVQALNRSGTAADTLKANVDRLAASQRELDAIRVFEKQAEDARRLVISSEYVEVFDQALRNLVTTERQIEAQNADDKFRKEAFAIVEAAESAKKLTREVDILAAAQRELGAQRAFEKQAADARKLVQAGEYVQFWRTELDKAEAQVEQTAQAAAAAGQKIKDAFQTLGVRSAQDLQAEIVQVRAAMETVKGSATNTGSALAGAFSAGEARIKALELDIRRVSGALTTTDRVAGLLKNSMGQITAGNIIADGVGYLVNKVKELGVAFVSTIVQTEQLRKGLQAVYKDTNLAGAQFDFLKKTANAAGVDVAGLGQSFLKFSAANKNSNVPLAETNALFLAVARAGGALGLSGEQVNGTLDALGQIASKGTVSMEELRQQLGDRLPGALGLTAKGLGITDAQLIKLVESGGLAYRDFVVPFTKSLGELQGATDGLLPSYQRFKNALTETAQNIGDAGFTQVLTAGLKALAVVVGAIVVPLAQLIEGFFLAGKAAAALASGLSGNKNALSEFTLEAEKSQQRMDKLQQTFLSAAGVQDQATAAQNANNAAMQASGLAAAKAALSVEGVAASQKAQAFSAALAADSTLDYGAKLVQLNTFISEALSQQGKQTEASEKTAKAIKIEGENMVKLAELRGDDSALIAAQVLAANLNVEALAKVNASQSEETRLLQLQRDTLIATAQAQDGTLEKRKTEIEAIEKKLVVSAAETEQSKQAEAAARAHALSIGLSAEAYKDNALRVGEYTIKLAEANAELVRAQFLERQGLATKNDVAAAQERVSAAQNRVNDSLRDAIDLIDRESRAKTAAIGITQAKLAVEQAGLETSAQIARAAGDNFLALQYEIQAKEVQIKSIRIATEVKKLELTADLASIEVQRAQIPVGDELRKVKEAELDTRIAVIKAKQIELGLSNEAIRALENEVTALRNSNGERASGQGTISKDTQLRDQNTTSINRQTDALTRQKTTSDGLLANKDGSAAGTFGGVVPIDKAFSIRQKVERGTLNEGDLADAQTALQQATDAKQFIDATLKSSPGSVSLAAIGDANAMLSAARVALTQIQGIADSVASGKTLPNSGGAQPPAFGAPALPVTDTGVLITDYQKQLADAKLRGDTGDVADLKADIARLTSGQPDTTASTGKSYTVNINIGSNSGAVNVASEADAKALVALLRGLESGKGTAS